MHAPASFRDCRFVLKTKKRTAVRAIGPPDAEEAAVVAGGPSSGWPGEAGGREVPVKLRHLKVAAERGHLEAMYLLAQECDDPVARIHWLTMAAERGHVPAMHDLGLASAALHERRRWSAAPPGTVGPRPWPNWATWSARERLHNRLSGLERQRVSLLPPSDCSRNSLILVFKRSNCDSINVASCDYARLERAINELL